MCTLHQWQALSCYFDCFFPALLRLPCRSDTQGCILVRLPTPRRRASSRAATSYNLIAQVTAWVRSPEVAHSGCSHPAATAYLYIPTRAATPSKVRFFVTQYRKEFILAVPYGAQAALSHVAHSSLPELARPHVSMWIDVDDLLSCRAPPVCCKEGHHSALIGTFDRIQYVDAICVIIGGEYLDSMVCKRFSSLNEVVHHLNSHLVCDIHLGTRPPCVHEMIQAKAGDLVLNKKIGNCRQVGGVVPVDREPYARFYARISRVFQSFKCFPKRSSFVSEPVMRSFHSVNTDADIRNARFCDPSSVIFCDKGSIGREANSQSFRGSICAELDGIPSYERLTSRKKHDRGVQGCRIIYELLRFIGVQFIGSSCIRRINIAMRAGEVALFRNAPYDDRSVVPSIMEVLTYIGWT